MAIKYGEEHKLSRSGGITSISLNDVGGMSIFNWRIRSQARDSPAPVFVASRKFAISQDGVDMVL
jgi:hypothetical protein